ncbi:MAG: hypothetical protein MZV63_19735 [Marinilabiliales bacterium]|nr:hypothetical protein [Marinilabiliales bacterium]
MAKFSILLVKILLKSVRLNNLENAFEYKTYLVVNGKESFLNGGSFIYSPKEDKFKGFVYRPSGNYQTWIGSFTTEQGCPLTLFKT